MNLSREQEMIIYDNSKYLQIIAGAGSGKTLTVIEMVNRVVQDKHFNEEEILLITFSKKACNEMRERLEKKMGISKVKIYTFHAYCLRILKLYHPDFSNKLNIISPEEKEELFKKFLIKHRFKIGGIPFEFFLSDRDKVKMEFKGIKSEFEDSYRNYKKNSNSIDYDDMVEIYLNGLINNLTWAKSAKEEISFVVVDEFQDTDPIQLSWLKHLSPRRLTVVGDDWQAIYGFRGATSEPFIFFEKYFYPLKKLFLTTNFRSDRNIVKVSEIPILKNKFNIKKKVVSHSVKPGLVRKIILQNESNWHTILNLANSKKDYMILVRTNYRIEKLKRIGFPQNRISTIHASKGLEYENVFIDLSEGWSRDIQSGDIDIEEERRILYVGLSRAKHELFIIGWADGRENGLDSKFFSYFS